MTRYRSLILASIVLASFLSTQGVLAQGPTAPPPSASPDKGTADVSDPSPVPTIAPAAPSFEWPTLTPPSRVPVPVRFRPGGRPYATSTRAGVRVQLWLSSPSAAPGQWVQALVRTTNLGDDPAYAWASACQTSGTGVAVDLRSVIPPGREQTGNAAAFKEQASRGSMRSWFQPWRHVRQYYTLALGLGQAFVECTFGSRPNKLGPGASRDEYFAWYPASSFDEDVWFQPLPPGDVAVTAAWPHISRGERPRADSRSLYRRIRPITATAELELPGDGPGTPSMPELVDIALADPEFGAWVDAHPERDPVMNRGAAFLDPWTGQVLDVWFLGPDFERRPVFSLRSGAESRATATPGVQNGPAHASRGRIARR